MLGNSGIFYALAVFYAQLYDFQTVSFYFSVRLDAFKYLLLLFFLFNLNVGFTFGWFFFPFTILSNQAVRM